MCAQGQSARTLWIPSSRSDGSGEKDGGGEGDGGRKRRFGGREEGVNVCEVRGGFCGDARRSVASERELLRFLT